MAFQLGSGQNSRFSIELSEGPSGLGIWSPGRGGVHGSHYFILDGHMFDIDPVQIPQRCVPLAFNRRYVYEHFMTYHERTNALNTSACRNTAGFVVNIWAAPFAYLLSS
jgi:hypothetical protein